jgi:pantoate--beta-alanine ligase
MKIIQTANKITKELSSKKKIGFIPTMGCLHEGHISLIKKAKQKKLVTVVSIFINPLQFNNKKDLKKYPKQITKDLKICRKNNVNYVFLPNKKEIYPEKFIILNNEIHAFKKHMEGKFRPGHFEGVIEVIKRLLKIIKPNYIFLGKKDYQQLILIKKYLLSIKSKIKVIACSTIRSVNGVALSSRNKLLDKSSFIIAEKIYNYLKKRKKLIIKSKNKSIFLEEIKKIGVKKIEYLKTFNVFTLKETNTLSSYSKIFIAYYLNGVRLIDNL